MTNQASFPTGIVPIAEQVLARTFGRRIHLVPGEGPAGGSGRSHIVRCAVVDGPADAPSSVILKSAALEPGETYAPDAPSGPSLQLYNEWASLEFLTLLDLDPTLGPRFLGGDRQAGLVVMEDLGSGESVVEALLGTDRNEAERTLEAYFRSLGRLNAVTYGHHERYKQIRSKLGPLDPVAEPVFSREYDLLMGHFTQLCTMTGVTPAPGCDKDIMLATAFAAEPGPFMAFSQSDTCPDNCLVNDGWVRFLDFEWGCFRSALNDGARARSNFPTCWCVNRLPADLIRCLEHVYRAELVKGCPAAEDDSLFFQEVVKACAFWALYSFEFYRDIWNSDGEWGIATIRQRAIVRFELLAQATVEYGYMEALGTTAQVLAEKLQARWPDTPPMPYYPPFR